MSDALAIIFLLAVIFFCIIWTVLPFAIFGIKKRLDTIIYLAQTQRNYEQPGIASFEAELRKDLGLHPSDKIPLDAEYVQHARKYYLAGLQHRD